MTAKPEWTVEKVIDGPFVLCLIDRGDMRHVYKVDGPASLAANEMVAFAAV